jgi:hypothetical protein
VKAAERLIYHISREKASGAKLSRSARLAIRRRRICGAKRRLVACRATAKRAFCHGTEKNQQRSASEPPQTGMGESSGTLNLLHIP